MSMMHHDGSAVEQKMAGLQARARRSGAGCKMQDMAVVAVLLREQLLSMRTDAAGHGCDCQCEDARDTT
jgi:hypothetical protein